MQVYVQAYFSISTTISIWRNFIYKHSRGGIRVGVELMDIIYFEPDLFKHAYK